MTAGALVAVVATTIGAAALGRGAATDVRLDAARPETVPVQEVPAVRIIRLDGERTGMLDTRTGAVFELRGNPRNASSRLTWLRRVPPVAGPKSGMLEIQRATSALEASEATFLVDVVTGRTWVLRDRGSGNGSWDPVVREG